MNRHKKIKRLKGKEVRYLNQLIFQTDVRNAPWKDAAPILEWGTGRIFNEEEYSGGIK